MRIQPINHDSAVSPVVGVMLMLVVTIIIAAVVSAFAGGISESEVDSEHSKISATFSQSGGLAIYHEGGDILQTREIQVIIQPVIKSVYYSWEVNKSVLGNIEGTKFWTNLYSSKRIETFKPGDIAFVSNENLKWTQTRPDGTNDYMGTYGNGKPENIGSEFRLYISDMKGKVIGSTNVLVAP